MKTHIYKLPFFLFLFLLLCGKAPAQQPLYKLVLATEKAYSLGAEGSDGVINANSRRSPQPEVHLFTYIDMGNDRIALQAPNGRYVAAEGGGGRELVANRDAVGPWETFTKIDLGGKKIALQAANGKYVCAEGGGGGEVVANRDAVGPWETFTMVIWEELPVDRSTCPKGRTPPQTLYLFINVGNVTRGGTDATVKLQASFEDWNIDNMKVGSGFSAGETKKLHSGWKIPTKDECGTLKSMWLTSVSILVENDTTFSDQLYLDSISVGLNKDNVISTIHIGQWLEQGQWHTFHRR